MVLYVQISKNVLLTYVRNENISYCFIYDNLRTNFKAIYKLIFRLAYAMRSEWRFCELDAVPSFNTKQCSNTMFVIHNNVS